MLTTFFRLAALNRSRMPSWPQHVTVPLRRTAHVRPREAAMRLSPLRAAPRTKTGPRTTAARSASGRPISGSSGPGLGENARADPLPEPAPVAVPLVALEGVAGSGPSAAPPRPSTAAATSPEGPAVAATPAQRRPTTASGRTRRLEPSRFLGLDGPGCWFASGARVRNHRCEPTTTSDGSPPAAGSVATDVNHRSPLLRPAHRGPGWSSGAC